VCTRCSTRQVRCDSDPHSLRLFRSSPHLPFSPTLCVILIPSATVFEGSPAQQGGTRKVRARPSSVRRYPPHTARGGQLSCDFLWRREEGGVAALILSLFYSTLLFRRRRRDGWPRASEPAPACQRIEAGSCLLPSWRLKRSSPALSTPAAVCGKKMRGRVA
jgi:hypothetical protein